MAKADEAVRKYLLAVREPDALKDTEGAKKLKQELASAEDPIERLGIQQRLIEAQHIDPQRYEAGFVEHAKAWADSKGVSHAAFQAEGVPDAVLRRAGFSVRRTGGPRRRADGAGGGTRVSAEEVRQSIPKGTFTVKDVQEASGASMAVVRRVVGEEVEAGNVTEEGADPNHQGPGRVPTLYRKR